VPYKFNISKFVDYTIQTPQTLHCCSSSHSPHDWTIYSKLDGYCPSSFALVYYTDPSGKVVVSGKCKAILSLRIVPELPEAIYVNSELKYNEFTIACCYIKFCISICIICSIREAIAYILHTVVLYHVQYSGSKTKRIYCIASYRSTSWELLWTTSCNDTHVWSPTTSSKSKFQA